MQARIRTVGWEADGILSYCLQPLAGECFPAFTAGSHVKIDLGEGLARSYSLLNSPDESNRYEIAVQLDPASRGGSRRIHDTFRPGQVIDIACPENFFALREDAAHSVLIAGGIGITPLLSMIARLDALGRSWELHYAARTRRRAAFLERLEHRPSVKFYGTDETEGGELDLARVMRAASAGAHFYCCGPEGMIASFKAETARVPPAQVHFEYFSADTEAAVDGGYRLELARSGKCIDVQAGETMLDALLNAGVNIGFACSEGICGTCRVKVLDGEPDHRDLFLTDAEKASNESVMVCCSGARSRSLVLDL